MRFASINVNPYDAGRLGATGIVADAKRALAALAETVRRAGTSSPADWQERARARNRQWQTERGRARPRHALRPLSPGARLGRRPDTGAVLTQGQIIGLLQEHARAGDVIIAPPAAPGDLEKVWDATEGRLAHLEFGFSCMGYELPAAIGVRLAEPDPARRIVSFLGDGTFLMAPPSWSPPPRRAWRSPS